MEVDPQIPEAATRLLHRVDQVFIPSLALLEKTGPINRHTTFVPNGVRACGTHASSGDRPWLAPLLAVARPGEIVEAFYNGSSAVRRGDASFLSLEYEGLAPDQVRAGPPMTSQAQV
jgi:hypothetical protein